MNKFYKYCTPVLQALAILCLLAFVIFLFIWLGNLGSRGHKHDFDIYFVIGSLASAAFWFALSIVVNAAEIYIDKNTPEALADYSSDD